MSEPTPDFPNDSTASTNAVVRQIDCQYSFGKEHMSVILKFMGIASEVALWTSKFREGYRVLLSEIAQFSESVPTTGLQTEGKVVQSTFVTSTGSAKATIAINFPYASKVTWRLTKPATTTVTTWFEKSTDYEFGLEVYAGDESGAANAGDFEAWKNEKNKNIQNYKDFKYTVEGQSEPVELKDRTLELAKKWYAGIESVRRAYPEVIRKTQYFNIDDSSDAVDKSLIAKIKETPNLYYIDNTPDKIWTSKFKGFSWVKASYDVETEATEYSDIWNATVTESWLGIDENDRGAWDDDLYGANRWPFAGAKPADPKTDPPSEANGSGRVKPDTFTNQSDIKTIDLGTGFHAVDKDAFRAASTRGLRLLRSAPPGAPALESITMPSVSFIGDDAFNGAANLQSIVLSNRISFLGERVFKDCSAMTEAIVEPSIYELPASTFEGCSALDGSQGGAFTVGGLVNSLGEYAFKDCTALTAINCTNALTSIGANAFENDDALTSFTMGLDSTGSITIGNEAFKGCGALADIELPVPTITLGTDSFLNAFDDEVTVKAPLSFLSNIASPKMFNYIYPSFVTSIATSEWQNASNKDQLKSIVVPESVTSLGNNMCMNCTALESAVFSPSVTSSGSSTFNGCTALESLTVGGETLTTLAIGFANNCPALTSDKITITAPITTIGPTGATGVAPFRRCEALTDIDFLPETVTTIGQYAFSRCTALVSADLPTSLTSLGNYAFDGDTALKSVILPENATGTLTLGDSVFNGCSALERVELPVGALTVGSTIFNNALASESWIKAPFNSNLVGSIPSGKLVNYTYPSFTTSIANDEFRGNTNLKSVAIPGGVTSIGTNAFRYCGNLSSVTLAEGLTSISEGMFQECTSLTSIDLPSTVTSIGTNAFRSCLGLTGMDIPAAVTSIGVDVFRYCSGITAITMTDKDMATVQAMTNYPFGLTTGQVIHCSDGDITIS